MRKKLSICVYLLIYFIDMFSLYNMGTGLGLCQFSDLVKPSPLPSHVCVCVYHTAYCRSLVSATSHASLNFSRSLL